MTLGLRSLIVVLLSLVLVSCFSIDRPENGICPRVDATSTHQLADEMNRTFLCAGGIAYCDGEWITQENETVYYYGTFTSFPPWIYETTANTSMMVDSYQQDQMVVLASLWAEQNAPIPLGANTPKLVRGINFYPDVIVDLSNNYPIGVGFTVDYGVCIDDTPR